MRSVSTGRRGRARRRVMGTAPQRPRLGELKAADPTELEGKRPRCGLCGSREAPAGAKVCNEPGLGGQGISVLRLEASTGQPVGWKN